MEEGKKALRCFVVSENKSLRKEIIKNLNSYRFAIDIVQPDNLLQIKNEISEDPDGKFWQASKENVSVQVWEGKAKIKVRVSPGEKTISMKRIADIAVNAILEELKKED